MKDKTVAVVTRHGKQIHLWTTHWRRPGHTFCGRAVFDFALDVAPETATCIKCKEEATR